MTTDKPYWEQDIVECLRIAANAVGENSYYLRAAEYIEELRAEKRAAISTEALIALKSSQQADADGVVVRVSRQALDEAIAVLSHSSAKICRGDGRCQYAIDHGAEGVGHCPEGECCMPEQPEDYEAIGRAWCNNSSLEKWFPFTADELEYLKEQVNLLRQTNKASQVYRLAAEQKLQRVEDGIENARQWVEKILGTAHLSELDTAIRGGSVLREMNSAEGSTSRDGGQNPVVTPTKPPAYKYPETFCSQCGGEFGPGNFRGSHVYNSH